MSPWWGLGLTVVFLAINAFFVGAEFAVTSSRRSQIEPLVAEGRRGSAQALYALEHVSLMLAICQLGITVMSTSLGVIAEPALAHLLAVPLEALGASSVTVHAISFVLALLIVLYLHVVFGEMVPKNISIANPQKLLLWLAPPLVTIGHVIRPLVVAMDKTANWFLRRFHIEPSAEISATFTVEEVANIVQISQEEGKLTDELGLLTGTLEFSAEQARGVMVPLESLTTVQDTCTPAELERAVAQTGYSRFPVERGGQIIGYIHVKDVLYADEETREQVIPEWRIRPLIRLEADEEIEEVLRQMQKSGTHMAAVVPDLDTESEDLLGLIFLEDVLELLVGEVRDSLQRTIGPPA